MVLDCVVVTVGVVETGSVWVGGEEGVLGGSSFVVTSGSTVVTDVAVEGVVRLGALEGLTDVMSVLLPVLLSSEDPPGMTILGSSPLFRSVLDSESCPLPLAVDISGSRTPSSDICPLWADVCSPSADSPPRESRVNNNNDKIFISSRLQFLSTVKTRFAIRNVCHPSFVTNQFCWFTALVARACTCRNRIGA